jgi:hypothetical protein
MEAGARSRDVMYWGAAAMKKSILMVSMAVVIGIAWLAAADRACGQTRKPANKAKPTYAVCKIGEKYEVISSTEMKNKRKQITDQNKKAMDKYNDDLKADPKTPKPERVILKVLKSGFKTQEGAQDFLKAQQEKDEAGGDDKDKSKSKDTGGTTAPGF